MKVSAGEHCIGFRTISRGKKSPQTFYIPRDHFDDLERDGGIIVSDIHSFASLHRCADTGTLRIGFTWLSDRCGGEVTGWEESVTLPYDALAAFVRDSSQEGGPDQWKCLSLCPASQTRLIFHDQKRLRECLANGAVRRKLSRALRDHFHYPGECQIHLYHDFEPYSFFFREVYGGQDGIMGGLIFHNYQNDFRKAYYSVHT